MTSDILIPAGFGESLQAMDLALSHIHEATRWSGLVPHDLAERRFECPEPRTRRSMEREPALPFCNPNNGVRAQKDRSKLRS